MEVLQYIFPMLGFALCALVIVQLLLWSAHSITALSHNRKQFEISRELLKSQIAMLEKQRKQLALERPQGWSGFRPFRVERLERETELCTSVYLRAEDGKPIPDFKPGQHLTFRFRIPGESKPVVRCYSLSQAPGKPNYRITVKALGSPAANPMLPPGRASNFIHSTVIEGDCLDVKAPSGSFFLDEHSKAPVVLLAGGIGITPMISIIDHIIQTKSDRLVVLVYGVRNGRHHAFKEYLFQVANQHQNIHVITCYSEPALEEKEAIDYHKKGFISIDLLKQVLPDNQCQFYLCGPAVFMERMYSGLVEWQVPDNRIFYEAFGPSSIGRKKKSTVLVEKCVPVRFGKSNRTAEWAEDTESILQLADQSEVAIDSGCRAGSCGTCKTAILNGNVRYDDDQSVDCEPGYCLACIAKPDGPVELDA